MSTSLRSAALVLAVLPLAFVGCGGGGGGSGISGPVDVAVLYSLTTVATATISPIDQAYLDDMVAKLTATGAFGSVTPIDLGATTPSLATLLTYDAVLVSVEDPILDIVGLGDALADFVDAGGGVVLAMYSLALSPSGRFQTDDYYVVTTAGTTSGAVSLGTVLLPGHPIMQGVASLSATSHPPSTSLATGAAVVAEWSDTYPAIAVRTLSGNRRRADLGFFPASWDAGANPGWDPATDGDQVMVNALLWTSKHL